MHPHGLEPARQGRAFLDYDSSGPVNAPLFERAGEIIVRAEDIEISAIEAAEQLVDRLLWRSCAGRVFCRSSAIQACEDETRHQKVD
jgi:hypothetical protein